MLNFDFFIIRQICCTPRGYSVIKVLRDTNDDHMFQKQYPLADNFVNSHHLSALQCIKIVRRIYILITPGSQRLKKLHNYDNNKPRLG